MATQGLFNLLGATPEEIRSKYEQGLMGAPISSVPLESRPAAMGAGLGRQLGYSIGRMLGGRVPGEAEAEARQQAMKQALESGEVGSSMYTNLARQYEAAGDYGRAFAAMQEAKRLKTEEDAAAAASQEAKDKRTKTQAGVDARLIALRNKFKPVVVDGKETAPEFTDEQLQKLAEDPETAKSLLGKDVKSSTEFERLIADLPPEKQQELRLLRAQNLATGNKNPSLADALTQMRLLEMKREASEKQAKTDIEKRERKNAFYAEKNALEDAVTFSDNLIKTAQETLDLWESAGGIDNIAEGTLAAIAQKIPGTNQQVIRNLVDELTSSNVIDTMLRLKERSSTGSTGFGAISAPELRLLKASRGLLDPTAKNFGKKLIEYINLHKTKISRLKEALSLHVSDMRTEGLEVFTQPDAGGGWSARVE